MESEPKSLPEYRNAFRALKTGKDPAGKKAKIRIACLSSFTITGIEEILSVKAHFLGIETSFYTGKYNQVFNEIMSPESDLYSFKPDLVILFMDIRSICGDDFFVPYQKTAEERKEWVHSTVTDIHSLLDELKKRSSAKIVLHNFEVPFYSPYGILENKQEYGFIEAVEEVNSALRKACKTESSLFILDYNGFCSAIGKKRVVDFKMYYLGDVKLSWEHMPALCDLYLAYIKPMLSVNRKCLVLDLDNTLWGGIIGEDGIDGIKLGPTPEGRSFWETQKLVLSLYKKGIILAINSKNNPEDALHVIRNHPHMVLQENCFASMQINWEDKISNMKRIAEEINIGLDALVFLDDDKLNREMIRDALPEVLVIDLPEDTAQYFSEITSINDFDTLEATEEDKKRGKMYAQQRERRDFSISVRGGAEKYLEGLQTVVTIEKVTNMNVPRVSQLTLKTNQFTMTTRRYQQEDIKRFLSMDTMLMVAVDVKDRFGENGVVGVGIVEKGETDWRVDTFLLSCRVLGRKIELAVLACIIERAREQGAITVTGEFIDSGRNVPARGFYKSAGFSLKEKEESIERWVFSVTDEFLRPDFIKIITKDET